jgi:hypothetical protein
LGSTINSIAGFAVSLGLAWGLLIFGELPSDVVPATFVQPILSTQFTWVAKIWFLMNHILLDVQLELSVVQLLVLAALPWFVCGISIGMLSRSASRGFAVSLLPVIISIVICWVILFLSPLLGIALPGDGVIATWISNPLLYVSPLLSLQAAALCLISGAGGALGGTVTHMKQ